MENKRNKTELTENKQFSKLLVTLFWVLVSIIICIQLKGLMFGLPQQYHPDEYYVNINTFRLFHELRDFKFEVIYYDLGVRWIYFAGFIVTYLTGTLFGIFKSFSHFYSLYFAYGNPYIDSASPWFYLPPRIISFCFYLGSLFFCYKIVSKAANSKNLARLTLLCAILLPGGYLYSHYGTRETACVLASLVLIYHLLFYYDPQKIRSVIVAGILLGAGSATKENCAIFVIPYLWLIFNSLKKKESGIYKSAGLTTLLITLATLVFFILNPQRIGYNNAEFVKSLYVTQTVDSSYPVPCSSHLIYPLAFVHEFSLPFLLIILAGIIACGIRLKSYWPMLIVFAGSYFVLDLSTHGFKADRFIMNIFLPFLIFGILGLNSIINNRKLRSLFLILPLLLFAGNYRELYSIYKCFNGNDSRDMARAWVEKNIPHNASIFREEISTPEVDSSRYAKVGNCWILGEIPVDSLRANGFNYLFFSDGYENGYIGGDSIKNRYEEFKKYTIKVFECKWRPKLNTFHSPKIYIAKLDTQ